MKKKLIYVLIGIVASSAVIFFIDTSNSVDIKEDQNSGQLADSINCDTITATQAVVDTEVNGVRITEIDIREYNRLLKDCHNAPLSNDSTHFNESSDSLIIRTEAGKITLLNHPYEEEVASDFFIEWKYDGYRTESKMSFFSFGGYEAWGHYIINKAGLITEFLTNIPPVFCKKSDLFATYFVDPYESIKSINVYKIRPDGRLSEIASINVEEEESIDELSWVGERSIVAFKTDQKEAPKHIRIDLTDEALKTSAALPLANPQEFNETVLSIQSKQIHSN